MDSLQMPYVPLAEIDGVTVAVTPLPTCTRKTQENGHASTKAYSVVAVVGGAMVRQSIACATFTNGRVQLGLVSHEKSEPLNDSEAMAFYDTMPQRMSEVDDAYDFMADFEREELGF